MNSNTITKVFDHNGVLFAIPFQIIDGEAYAFAQDIGKVFYGTDDERKAADNINRVASLNSGLFKGLRVDAYRAATDGKRYKSWAYSQKGVMALGLRVKSEIADKFVLWACDVMVALLKGETVSLKPMTQAQISLLQSQALVDIEAKQEIHDEKIQSLESRVESLTERAAHETILPEEVNTAAIAYRVSWFSRSGKLHTTAIAQVAKDRGFIQRGLARLADSWNEAAGWVKVLAFTVDGAKAFYQEVDEPYKGQDEFQIALKSGKSMHVCRSKQEAA